MLQSDVVCCSVRSVSDVAYVTVSGNSSTGGGFGISGGLES